MKERFIENGIEYVKIGDYYIPNLTVPQKRYTIGKYGNLSRNRCRGGRSCPHCRCHRYGCTSDRCRRGGRAAPPRP